MPKEFKFPDLGEGIEEGRIVRWDIREGDKVKEHQPVGEIETDKAVAEIPSPFSGVVLKINFKEGETVKVGEVLFVVGENGEKVGVAPKKEKPKVLPAGAVGYLEEAPDEVIEARPLSVSKPAKKEPKILATPSVRKLAADLGVDLSKVAPTGEGGRIIEEDIRKAEKPTIVVKRKYDMWGYVDRIPLKGIRRAIARHMVESVSHAPHVTVMDEADVSELIKLKEKEKSKAEAQGVYLTFLPFIMKACLGAIRNFPLLNSTLDEENDEIIVKKYYNFGFAVDVDGEGLVVPVVKGVDLKSIFDIAKELKDLSDKARQKKLDLQDMRGGTFTITNFGSIGSSFATPIINYPEVSILGLGKIKEKPVAEKGKIFVKPILPLSLAFDHRVLDGAYAVRFLNLLISILQNPENLLKVK